MKKLRIWWIPQVPMNAFNWEVNSPLEGKKMLDMLAQYDIFQFENKVKPDYSNAGGLQEFNEEAEEWWDYEDEECRCIDEIEYEELK